MVKSYWWGGGGGGQCDYSVPPSPNWTWFLIFDWFGFGLGSRRTGLGARA